MSFKLYVPKKYENYFQSQIKIHRLMGKMTVESIQNGIIAVEKDGTGYGVLDANGKFVKSSRQMRYKNSQFYPRVNPAKQKINYEDIDVIYLGNLYDHFGHFMLEHLTRTYVLGDPKYQSMKCVFVNNRKFKEIDNYIFQFMDLLGVKRDDLIILDDSRQFKSVTIPQQSFNLPVCISREYGQIFQNMAANVPSGHGAEKIYLSRTALRERRTFNEEQIENIFRKNGYKVVHPETLSLDQQVAAVKNCKSLAGLAGSALHHSLFMPQGGEVIQIKRNKIARDNCGVQYLLNQANNLDFTYIAGSIEQFESEHFTDTPQIVGITPELKQFFDDRGFDYNDQDIAFNQDSWDEYQKSLQEYIVAGHTETGDKIKRKIIKLISCVVPGRRNRNKFRNWLMKILYR